MPNVIVAVPPGVNRRLAPAGGAVALASGAGGLLAWRRRSTVPTTTSIAVMLFAKPRVRHGLVAAECSRGVTAKAGPRYGLNLIRLMIG